MQKLLLASLLGLLTVFVGFVPVSAHVVKQGGISPDYIECSQTYGYIERQYSWNWYEGGRHLASLNVYLESERDTHDNAFCGTMKTLAALSYGRLSVSSTLTAILISDSSTLAWYDPVQVPPNNTNSFVSAYADTGWQVTRCAHAYGRWYIPGTLDQQIPNYVDSVCP